MGYDPAKRKATNAKYREKNKEKKKEKNKEYYEQNKEKNKEKNQEYQAKYREDRKQHVVDSISAGEIIDRHKWDLWCNKIKLDAKTHKHPYSNDFTSAVIFEMLILGCFYCGDIATTIDRIDSKLEHTIDNCVGCCHGCNVSKGTADPVTFIRKAYYRARRKYIDDDCDIWFVHKNKPRMNVYNTRAKKKRVSFELTEEDWERLIKGDCTYCLRSPITWFGIDRVVPSLGYVLGNVVSCCFDCNVDKLEDDVDMAKARNERIAERVDSGDIVIMKCEKVILHKGTQPTTKKVCVHGTPEEK